MLTAEGGSRLAGDRGWFLGEVLVRGFIFSRLSSISLHKEKEIITPPPQKQVSFSQVVASSCDNPA